MKALISFVILIAVGHNFAACQDQHIGLTYPALTSLYIWNGASLMPLFSSENMPCDHWEIWYFKRGAVQTIGQQWGSISGKTSDDVLKKQQDQVKFDGAFSRFFNLPYPSSDFSFDNYLGPICITSAAFSANPRGLDQIHELAESADRAISLLTRALTNLQSFGENAGQSTKYGPQEQHPVMEFIKHIEETTGKINRLHSLIMTQTAPSAVQIEASMTSINRELTALESQSTELFVAPHRPKVTLPDLSDLTNPKFKVVTTTDCSKGACAATPDRCSYGSEAERQKCKAGTGAPQ